MRKGWERAAGSCGFAADGDVWATYRNGVGLFAWQESAGPRPVFKCVVTGHTIHTANSLNSVMVMGEALADNYGQDEANLVMSKKEFKALVANPARVRQGDDNDS